MYVSIRSQRRHIAPASWARPVRRRWCPTLLLAGAPVRQADHWRRLAAGQLSPPLAPLSTALPWAVAQDAAGEGLAQVTWQRHLNGHPAQDARHKGVQHISRMRPKLALRALPLHVCACAAARGVLVVVVAVMLVLRRLLPVPLGVRAARGSPPCPACCLHDMPAVLVLLLFVRSEV